jgi:sterol desaturase/sphingolipid hydroxylase (fatty acid hydroxylase superfamily)
MPTSHHSPWFVLTALVFVFAEWFWRSRVAQRGYDSRGAWASLAVGVGHLVSVVLGASLLGGLFLAVGRIAPLQWPVDRAWSWVAGFFLIEFVYYWQHRAGHRVRWMWATHAVHHTPEQLTFLSAIRLGWTNLLSLDWLFYLPAVWLGFDPRQVFVLLAFNLHYQFFLHTEAIGRLGPLEWIFNTPAHHRVHHAGNAEYLDCNYGGVLIIWDRLFGTLRRERAGEPVHYGLAHPLPSARPFAIAFGEWRRLLHDLRAAGNMSAALRVAFGKP